MTDRRLGISEAVFTADRAKIGADLFLQANMEYPNSVPHQGAKIALAIRAAKTYPANFLLMSVLQNSQQITRLREAADRMHQHHGRGPEAITEERVKKILNATFMLAHDLRFVPPFELEGFLTAFPPEIERYGDPDREWVTKAQLVLNDLIDRYRR